MSRRVKADPARKDDAIKHLRLCIKSGSVITTFSYKWDRRTGSTCHAVLAIIKGKIENISAFVSDAIGHSWDDRDGVWGTGHGIVSELSDVLFGDRAALKHKGM